GATTISEAGAEYLAALVPRDEDGLERLGNEKRLAVHFGRRDFHVFAEPGRDRVVPVDHPDTLQFARLAPFQAAGCAHEAVEDFGEMAGVEDDKPHPLPHVTLDTFGNRIGDIAMRGVAPPE